MNSIGLRHICLVRRLNFRMLSINSSYEDAICKLNSLQSNKSTIEQIKKGLRNGEKCTNLEDMENYLRRIGIPLYKLDELSVIHVAGTKGKGSTSAMCESILRHHGIRTGFYSSPHLVAARERIRLDGCPLSREEFAASVQHVYSLLWDTQEFYGDMPKYFAFLTVVAFHVFLQRRVDVAVVEVGIGGIVDYTNVLRKVPVVGITALGLDHTSILGHSLPEIAAAKAGVMKRGCLAYTVRQPPDAMRVLTAYAENIKCALTVVPDYSSYSFHEKKKSHLPVDLDTYRTNASLAIQLSHAWMRATQANIVQDSIIDRVDKDVNYLHNGLNTDQSGLNNGDDYIKNGLHINLTNGTNKDHIGLTNNIDTNIKSLHKNGIVETDKGQNSDINIGLQNMSNWTKIVQNGYASDTKNNLNMHTKVTNGIKHQNGEISNCKAENGNIPDKLVYEVSNATSEGLRQCRWPGRYQVIVGEYATFYLDGAHTKESMEICAQWFTDSCSSADKSLIFSATGDRNAAVLLQPLSSIPFDHIYFVIPTAYKATSTNQDNYTLVEREELVQRCHSHALIWQQNNATTKVTVLECVADALSCIKALQDSDSVLITGSLHLVGAALSILDPTLSS